MHLHILGICGTFMGSLAILASELGHRVTGSDANVYPPMSDQLAARGIALHQGYDPAPLDARPDLVVIGNAMSRGNPAVEAVLNRGLDYCSGPEWLARHLLNRRHVIAVAGTHGKTSTTSMVAWILECAGHDPGFLIGGVARDFGCSARIGSGSHFVVEADEYDTAFFDKRSKFIHYRPRTLLLNNLEYDHADIFPDLAAIQRQFHHLVRTVPGEGVIIAPTADSALQEVLSEGCWSRRQAWLGCLERGETIPQSGWWARLVKEDGSAFVVGRDGVQRAEVQWSLLGRHNVANAVMAMAAAADVGVDPVVAAAALGRFQGVKRRLEVIGSGDGITVYDDFAHHPTAIATTLRGLRRRIGNQSLLLLIEPRSNTMRSGVHRRQLPAAWSSADAVFWYQPEGMDWVPAADPTVPVHRFTSVTGMIERLVAERGRWQHLVIMSNGGFDGLPRRLVEALGLAAP
ncbi:MAG TPA: UDP-N-acetylmuramate:L-alanyl-gamma-D-glutamyl-meso-diaminopimelate ligase [Pseudomonadales bacterium]|nr:UDP-N-acetylmuramate:L-alanyl-gamma-D-glutamyl-meso-diaminopimelate ligase [Pseudomonadales bacterium]